MVRYEFGYKKMFDESLAKFKEIRGRSEEEEYQELLKDKGINDVISYDPCALPEYY
jgi:hypothetical protein